jgi:hypothetical protein
MIASLLPKEYALILKMAGDEANVIRIKTKNGDSTKAYKTLIARIDAITADAKLLYPYLFRSDKD